MSALLERKKEKKKEKEQDETESMLLRSVNRGT
jgi:hypothetical protein